MAISALLGPTNTGKTHRAIERMLEHRSGMMGLPLRLLAREVYDRVSAQCGEGQVALVTGEEKRVPPRPRYWVCTVEAMPMAQEVDFIAVDEIQLASHHERGHVFTDRLLSARGAKETWFMGAETMRDALGELVPTASIVKSPRLSTLRAVPTSPLSGLPKRSAVVGFSLSRVFELAERLRAKRGGAAVVIGALSPRARNAQVALYQAKEVDFLVATDAIGMGLNLDIDHVAFADLRKFDGRTTRDLDPSEIAQIAGRAGRYVKDGTFGTLAPLPDLSIDLRRAIEDHRFAPVRTLFWRNADLDYGSIGALLASLRRASPARRMKRGDRALDHAVLEALEPDPDVRRLTLSEGDVRLLWAACSIPDYRQLLFEEHVALVRRVFVDLATKGRLSAEGIERELDRIERSTTDLETLMDRIASIRTWNFIAHQAGWVERPDAIRERARQVEDELSDALHAALVARFVEHGRSSSQGVPRAKPSAKGSRPGTKEPPVDDAELARSPFAQLAKLRGAVRSAEPVFDEGEARSVEALIDAPHAAIELDESGALSFGGERVGRLSRGRSLALPEVVVTIDLDAGAKLRVSRRLVAWSRDLVQELVGALGELDGLASNGRGLVHLLSSGLGTVTSVEARAQLEGLAQEDRRQLEEAGVVIGRVVVYLPSSLKPEAVLRRAALASAFLGLATERPADRKKRPRWPLDGERSIAPRPEIPATLYAAVGYPVVGRRAVRADLLERLAGRLTRAEETEQPSAGKIASWLGCRPAEAEEIAAIIGPVAGTPASP